MTQVQIDRLLALPRLIAEMEEEQTNSWIPKSMERNFHYEQCARDSAMLRRDYDALLAVARLPGQELKGGGMFSGRGMLVAGLLCLAASVAMGWAFVAALWGLG